MNIPALLTERLLLRPWTMDDAGSLLEILQEEDILRYFPPSTPPRRVKVERYIAHHLEHWEKHGCGHWAVESALDGRLLGRTGLEYLPETGETEVAYLFSRSFWGQGLATEAARAAVQFGFESAGLEQIIGLVHPDNTGSRRVLEKCGLTRVDRKLYFGIELDRFRADRDSWLNEHGI